MPDWVARGDSPRLLYSIQHRASCRRALEEDLERLDWHYWSDDQRLVLVCPFGATRDRRR